MSHSVTTEFDLTEGSISYKGETVLWHSLDETVRPDTDVEETPYAMLMMKWAVTTILKLIMPSQSTTSQ